MQALMLDATWEPRAGHRLTSAERESRKAITASAVWKQPIFQMRPTAIPTIEADEVLVRVKVCGVCGSDTHCYETDDEGYVLFSGQARLPVTLGHEFSGEVVDVGRKVRGLKAGDPVAVESVQWCGACTPCRSGNPNQCDHISLLGFSAPGAFAEYVAVNQRYCWKLDSLRQTCGSDAEMYEIGSLIEPIGCAYNGMFISAGGFLPGNYIVIYGAGPIGLGALLMARAAGAAKIIVFELNEARNALALALGADYAASPAALHRQGTSPSEVVRELTSGQGADMQIEAAGAAASTMPEIQQSFAANGKLVYLGRASNSAALHFDGLVSQANQITGSRGHAGRGVFPNVIRLLATGRLPAVKMITSRFPFAQAIDAIKHSTARTEGKILVCMPD